MRVFVLLLILFLPLVALSQNKRLIDSLHQQLRITPEKEHFQLLNAIGWEYRSSLPDSTIYYSQKSIDLAKKFNLKVSIAHALNFIGVGYNYQGDFKKSYEFCQQAKELAESEGDSIEIGYSNNNIGRLLFEQGIVAQSFPYFLNGLKIFEKFHNQTGVAYAKQSLANLYQLQKNYKKAEQFQKEALSLRISLKKPRDIAVAYSQLAVLYQEINNLSEANKYLLRSDSVCNVIQDDINLARIKILLAKNYLKEGKLDEAQKIGEAGFNVIQRINNIRLLPEGFLIKGKIYFARKKYDQAKAEFSSALGAATTSKQSVLQMESYYQLAQVSKFMNLKQEEMSHLNHYFILKDSLEDIELTRQVERLQFELEIQTKERENEFLKLQQASTQSVIARQRLGTILLLVVVTFLVILALIIWQVSSRRKLVNHKLANQNQQIIQQGEEITRQNETLQKRNILLSDLNHEKNTLMSIVAHDLKSPLNRISALASLIKMEGSLTVQQQEYAEMIKNAVKSGSSLITDLLDVNEIEEGHNSSANTSFDLVFLLKERVNHFQSYATLKGIRLDFLSPDIIPFVSDSSYIDRILENLISNAIKFSKAHTQLVVTVKYENSNAIISVKDQGPGFTEADQKMMYKKFKRLSARPTASESSNGLGLAIVKTLVDRLGGSIQLITKVEVGSEFIVTLPIGSGTTNSISADKMATIK